jgi:branched-chain amino acid transport system substrate-binding protein
MAKPVIGASGLSRRGLLAAAAGTLFTAACGSDSESAGPNTRGSQELVVGAILELTGPAAASGSLQERALRITADRMNEDGVPVGNLRRRVRLVVRDNGSKPDTAAKQATEMAQRDQVHAIIGGTTAETSQSILQVAQSEQVAFLSLASADDIVFPLAQRTFIYKLTPDAYDVARLMTVSLKDALQAKRVAVLAGAGAHGDSGLAAVLKELDARGLELAAQVRLPASGGNFAAAARTVVNSEPDSVIIWAQAPDSGAAALALQKAGFAGRKFFDPGAVAEETLTGAVAPAVEGGYVVHPKSLAGSTMTDTTRADLVRRDFVNRYIQKYGGFSGFAPYASDALTMVASAARAGRSVDRGRIRVFLETQVAEGIAGSYQFAPISHGGMEADSLAVFTISSGSWQKFS